MKEEALSKFLHQDKIIVGMDETSLPVMLAGVMVLEAVLHSDPAKVIPALHCDSSKDTMAMAVGLLDDMGLMGEEEDYKKVIRLFVDAAISWLNEKRPEVVLKMAMKTVATAKGGDEVPQEITHIVLPKKGEVN